MQCPMDLEYLHDFIFPEDTEEIDKNMKEVRQGYTSDIMSRAGGTPTMCKKACRYGYQICLAYRRKKSEFIRVLFNCVLRSVIPDLAITHKIQSIV